MALPRTDTGSAMAKPSLCAGLQLGGLGSNFCETSKSETQLGVEPIGGAGGTDVNTSFQSWPGIFALSVGGFATKKGVD